jgi:tetratricopeptide (TPR) repeat protein
MRKLFGRRGDSFDGGVMKLIGVIAWLLMVLVGSVEAVSAQGTPAKESKPELVSLLGIKLYAKKDEKGDVATAEKKLAGDPKNIDLLIALGRAQGTIWRFNEAVATFTQAIKLDPNNSRLYRLRGHRYISLRQFDKALVDLKQAAVLNGHGGKDADLDFDILYHLALAFYLKGEFAKASETYERCRELSKTDDRIIAVSDWLYMSYRRQKKDAEAAKVLERITSQMKAQDNKSYYDRLLFYKGLKKENELLDFEKGSDLEVATIGYGLGNWYLAKGNRAKADEYFKKAIHRNHWGAFGYIASEVELARKKTPPTN